MMFRRGFSRLACLALIGVCVLPVSGCDSIGDLILGERYRGPRPAEEAIFNEVAIVRGVTVTESGQTALLLDRVRFTDAGEPHNVNRVVRVLSGASKRDEVAALNLDRGDRVVVSTEFQGVTNAIGSMSVPDWPGHGAYEYPIGIHAVTAIARAGS